jgi:hypothetical protein
MPPASDDWVRTRVLFEQWRATRPSRSKISDEPGETKKEGRVAARVESAATRATIAGLPRGRVGSAQRTREAPGSAEALLLPWPRRWVSGAARTVSGPAAFSDSAVERVGGGIGGVPGSGPSTCWTRRLSNWRSDASSVSSRNRSSTCSSSCRSAGSGRRSGLFLMTGQVLAIGARNPQCRNDLLSLDKRQVNLPKGHEFNGGQLYGQNIESTIDR